jgi:hypothetical protein
MIKFISYIAVVFFSLSVNAADTTVFNVLQQNSDVVVDVRFEENNIWIKLAPQYINDTITVRISNRNRDFYRPWHHGDIDLVSTGYRGNNIWTDRVQTQANYVEYWLNETMILHMARK